MSVFLEIFEAFDKIWHEGLLYKFKSMGISGEFITFLKIIYQVGSKGLF